MEKLPHLSGSQAAETTGAVAGGEGRSAFWALSHPDPGSPLFLGLERLPRMYPNSGCLTRLASFSLLTL